MNKQVLVVLAMVLMVMGCNSTPTDSQTLNANLPYSDIIEQPYRIAPASQSYGKDKLQRIYYWPTAEQPRTIMVFIHGGCWLNAYDYTHARGLFTALAKQGVATFAIEYRRTGDEGGGWPGSLNDINQALPKIKQWIDKDLPQNVPVYLAGHSAGGHLALLAAQSVTFPVEGVIGLAAITDPVSYAQGDNSCQTATPLFFNGTPEEQPQAYAAATPTTQQIVAEVTLLQGDADAIVPLSQSELVGSKPIIVAGAGHFDWLHQHTAAYQQLLNVLNKGAR
ncbi:alpha/beta hydrolase [Alteromonas lipolytica]|uniref:BD-FAE-like domain-containing protein n=1 Tax=Alteromonas lipolytica TaxID=1856405 RepID=A0A1E8F892_9ALTE|nr:alpha/beta hydrolase [Alteromonas lipolytica]OFI32137.1 hypothetical protein BFC17_07875 [Alteromonas lipolytica]GGF83591.1 hypothetical protein GCM10011338_39920 [Alteromonas lipolytica]